MSTFDEHDKERYLARRIHDMWPIDIFEGTTDRDIRRERALEAIVNTIGAAVICGRGQDGKPQTFAQVFEAVYGAPLAPAPTKSAKGTAHPQAQSARDGSGAGR